jgi:hypothetical protein
MKKTRLPTAAELLSVLADRRRPGAARLFFQKEQKREFTLNEEAFGHQRPRVTDSVPDLGVPLATLGRRPRGRLGTTRGRVVRYSFNL